MFLVGAMLYINLMCIVSSKTTVHTVIAVLIASTNFLKCSYEQ